MPLDSANLTCSVASDIPLDQLKVSAEQRAALEDILKRKDRVYSWRHTDNGEEQWRVASPNEDVRTISGASQIGKVVLSSLGHPALVFSLGTVLSQKLFISSNLLCNSGHSQCAMDGASFEVTLVGDGISSCTTSLNQRANHRPTHLTHTTCTPPSPSRTACSVHTAPRAPGSPTPLRWPAAAPCCSSPAHSPTTTLPVSTLSYSAPPPGCLFLPPAMLRTSGRSAYLPSPGRPMSCLTSPRMGGVPESNLGFDPRGGCWKGEILVIVEDEF
ncbi:hypothetical protein DFH07DRAFT_784662 [Mycena maculata]|uniref:Uncharacterized protein n=1 Tax=Mycena maculata TaxID=230809 RepID=A0AAD7HGL0_9AGAR|nr:hypothetical protein DFH07DRAFT_784662 [Mycena maculata]